MCVVFFDIFFLKGEIIMANIDNKLKETIIKSTTNVNDGKTNLEIISGYSNINDFTKNGFGVMVEATRSSNSLPQDRDWDFYKTHESFRNLMNTEGNDILLLMNSILKQQGVFGNIKNRDLEEKIELIIEANDIILERVANNLDEVNGISKNPPLAVEMQTVTADMPVSGSWNKMNNTKITVQSNLALPKSTTSPNSIRLLTAKNIQRPQICFKDRIDNSKNPWEPRIKDKPNSLKPLAIYLEHTDDGLGEIFCHPYEYELERFEPSVDQLTPAVPQTPPPLSETPLTIVDTPEGLENMLKDLYNQTEIAVDLEHHSYRTYMGITCLMQISTRKNDYLVDTLALRDKLHILNEVFTKKSVVKIFHGADHDVLWLQRDLSLYVVNMFDTHQAAKQLGYHQLSLAYLLKRFCGVDANKHFQLADWRIRPLPDELKTYAREDTHYLLYIYHKMRNEIIQTYGANVLKAVITNSTQICLKRYEKPIMREDIHMDLYRRCKKLFDKRQMFALKCLYQWRDSLAREEDESTGFILPNHMLLQIAELLPREMQGILACCNPIPPLVRANLLELHKIVLMAREQSVVKPILSEETRSRGSTQQTTNKINLDSPLNCPHDLTKTEEFRDDLPTLLGNILKQKPRFSLKTAAQKNVLDIEKGKSDSCVFYTSEKSYNIMNKSDAILQKNKMKKLAFLGPYERYKLVKKYLQYEEEANNKEVGDKSDTGRIAALQEHFKQLASNTQQQTSENVEKERRNDEIMTGVKRKRSSSPKTAADNNFIPACLEVNEGMQQSSPKRCKNQNEEWTSPRNAHNLPNPGPGKKNKFKNRQKHQNSQQSLNIQQSNSPSKNKDKKNREKNQNETLNDMKNRDSKRKWNPQNKPPHNSPRGGKSHPEQHYSPRGNKRPQSHPEQHSPRGGKRRQRNTHWEESEQPFDYNSVDFRQFQGGASSANQPNNFASHFKSRGSKNRRHQSIGRNNNKSSSFGGNRGRGRGFRGGK